MKPLWKDPKYAPTIVYIFSMIVLSFLYCEQFKQDKTFKTFLLICYAFGFLLIFILALYEFFQYLQRRKKFQEKIIKKKHIREDPKYVLGWGHMMLTAAFGYVVRYYFKGNKTLHIFAGICLGVAIVWLLIVVLYEVSCYLRRKEEKVSGEKI